jgi:hypothetical protein
LRAQDAEEKSQSRFHVSNEPSLLVDAQPLPYLLQMNAVDTSTATLAKNMLPRLLESTPATSPQETANGTESGQTLKSSMLAPSAQKPQPTPDLAHLDQDRALIEKLLEEVNSSRYAVDYGVRYGLHDGVLDLYWQEWAPLRDEHSDDTLRDLLAQSPVLARH